MVRTSSFSQRATTFRNTAQGGMTSTTSGGASYGNKFSAPGRKPSNSSAAAKTFNASRGTRGGSSDTLGRVSGINTGRADLKSPWGKRQESHMELGQRTSPWKEKSRIWGALTGDKRLSDKKESRRHKKARDKKHEIDIKFIDGKGKTKKDFMIKYNSRKSKQQMEVYLQEGENRKMTEKAYKKMIARKISAEMSRLSRAGKNFSGQQSLNHISHLEEVKIWKKINKNRDYGKTVRGSRRGTLGRGKSSRRKVSVEI